MFLRPDLARRARFARKQAGQLASKMRFIAAQFDALLANDLWLHTLDTPTPWQLAAALGDVPAVEVVRAPQANSVFARPVPSHRPAAELIVLLDLGLTRKHGPLDDQLRDDGRRRVPACRRRAPRHRSTSPWPCGRWC